MPSEYKKNNERALIKNTAKMRDQPNPNSSVIRFIPVGDLVYIVGFTDGYWKIYYDGQVGYLSDGLYFEAAYGMLRFKK